jgi:hypothetical protein
MFGPLKDGFRAVRLRNGLWRLYYGIVPLCDAHDPKELFSVVTNVNQREPA